MPRCDHRIADEFVARARTAAALLCALLATLVAPAPVAAQDDEPQVRAGAQEADGTQQSSRELRESRRKALRARRRAVRRALARDVSSEQKAVHIFQLVEEITDDLITDVSELDVTVASPMAMRPVQLSSNLGGELSWIVGAYLRSALLTYTDLKVKRCIACSATKSRVVDGEWVIERGLTEHADLKREAERLGVSAFLDTRLAYFPGANLVALQAEVLRASDGAVLWSETYRSDATTASVLRSGVRVPTRSERVTELERKIDEEPIYGHTLHVGGALIPYDAPDGNVSGVDLGYRFIELFGEDRRWLYGLDLSVLINPQITAGLFAEALLQYQINEPNLNMPSFRTGPAGGAAILFSNEGSSAIVEWTFDAVLQFRLGAGVSLFYYLPTKFAGLDLGGFGLKGRITFNW